MEKGTASGLYDSTVGVLWDSEWGVWISPPPLLPYTHLDYSRDASHVQ